MRVLDGSKSSIISIHALLAESDASMRIDTGHNFDFYPRSPCGERRSGYPETHRPCAISIHALLAESDLGNAEAALPMWNFYPRSPCGERLIGKYAQYAITGISIHALLAESDSPITEHDLNNTNISIHALLAESDLSSLQLYYNIH